MVTAKYYFCFSNVIFTSFIRMCSYFCVLPLAAIISQRLFLFTIGSNATNISQSLYFLYHWCNYYLTQTALLFTIDSDPSNKHRDSILFTTATALLIIDSVAYVTLHKLYFLHLILMQLLSQRARTAFYYWIWCKCYHTEIIPLFIIDADTRDHTVFFKQCFKWNFYVCISFYKCPW